MMLILVLKLVKVKADSSEIGEGSVLMLPQSQLKLIRNSVKLEQSFESNGKWVVYAVNCRV